MKDVEQGASGKGSRYSLNGRPPRREIIAVTGKGGTGKTTFTAIASKLLISRGLHPLVIDADPPVSLALAMGVEDLPTVGDLRQRLIEDPGEKRRIGDRHIKDVLIEEALAELPDFSFMAIGRSEGPGCFCGINELLKYGIESLSERYELTLIDCEAGIEQINRRVLSDIDTLIIVSDPTIKGLKTAAHLENIAQVHGVNGTVRILLVLNRMANGDAELLGKVDESGLDLAGTIPLDRNVSDFDRAGRPILELPDDAPSVRAVSKILDRLGYPADVRDR